MPIQARSGTLSRRKSTPSSTRIGPSSWITKDAVPTTSPLRPVKDRL